jgi:hypothetical protein
VWTIAGSYIVELLGRLILQPDVDRINGFKYAFQSFQQSLVMLFAALTSTEFLQLDLGQNLCLLLSVVQVWLAIPEQIIGLMIVTVLHKKGIATDPDLKSSEVELVEELRMEKISAADKIKSSQEMAAKLEEIVLCFASKGIYALIVSIISDRHFLLCLNKLNPGALNPFLRLVFNSEIIVCRLKELAGDCPPIELLIDNLLNIQWVTSVDFYEGMKILSLIEDSLDGFSAILSCISESDYTRAIQKIISSRAVLNILNNRYSKACKNQVDGAVYILKQIFKNLLVQSKIIATKNANPDLEDVLTRILNLSFDNAIDLDDYLFLLERLNYLNTSQSESDNFSALDLVESIDQSTSFESLCCWREHIPEPWQSVYIELLQCAAAISPTASQLEKNVTSDNSGFIGPGMEHDNLAAQIRNPIDLKNDSEFFQSTYDTDNIKQKCSGQHTENVLNSKELQIGEPKPPLMKVRAFQNQIEGVEDLSCHSSLPFSRSSALAVQKPVPFNAHASLGFLKVDNSHLKVDKCETKLEVSERLAGDESTKSLSNKIECSTLQFRHSGESVNVCQSCPPENKLMSNLEIQECCGNQSLFDSTLHCSKQVHNQAQCLQISSDSSASEMLPIPVSFDPELAALPVLSLRSRDFIAENLLHSNSSFNENFLSRCHYPLQVGTQFVTAPSEAVGVLLEQNLSSLALPVMQHTPSNRVRQLFVTSIAPSKDFIAEKCGRRSTESVSSDDVACRSKVEVEQALHLPSIHGLHAAMVSNGPLLHGVFQSLPGAFVPEFSENALETDNKPGQVVQPLLEDLLSLCLACSYDDTSDNAPARDYMPQIELDLVSTAPQDLSKPAALPASNNKNIVTYRRFLLHSVELIESKDIEEILVALQSVLPESVQELLDPVFDVIEETAERMATQGAGIPSPGKSLDSEHSIQITQSLQDSETLPEKPSEAAADGLLQDHDCKSIQGLKTQSAGICAEESRVRGADNLEWDHSQAGASMGNEQSGVSGLGYKTPLGMHRESNRVEKGGGSILLWMLGCGIIISSIFAFCLIAGMAFSTDCGCVCLNNTIE